MNQERIMSARQLIKQFDGTTVLHSLDLELRPGEIHALVGENGAGKSTVIKILSGVYQPDGGFVEFNGQPVKITDPSVAHKLGVFTVHQEPAMMPQLSVAENIFMGFHPYKKFGIRWMDRKEMYRQAQNLFEQLGVSLDIKQKAYQLSIAQQQMVEIAKALVHQVRVLILDEPTATLSAHETEVLFRIVKQLRDTGTAVLFVSHRLEEVFSLTSRITVMRDGAKVGTYQTSDLTEKQLVSLMVGREIELSRFRSQQIERTNPLLSITDLSKSNSFSNISFDLYPGEILGLSGLVGSGRTYVAEAIFGIHPADSGHIRINGLNVRIRSVSQAIKHGIVYVPEDRHRHGVALEMNIFSNISVPSLKQLSRYGVIQKAEESSLAQRMMERVRIRASSIRQKVGELSGGNQQKVVFSKWISCKPRIVLLDEPTRGVDIGAKKEIHRMIHQLAEEGAAILLISSDLPEVLSLADRVMVMREGKMVAEVAQEEISEEIIASHAAGVHV
ncbi:D-ribose transporter ATP binding protein [Brevibacillus panacihumi W25]|uniref:D-ribose transporter ATP binding protein n=1 Tax=Brevibacillus panacihumi W25 TaxID=1408254 RepID=V6MJJ7_9BACL|nr:sugar ABC transporter ATP-binding protein [Brevibacillus panacihumi]EST55608.1 D-ribose transporter ATP binding protein [Brevibacillus panacihumi W25]